ncbi:MAG: ATP synthase F1 subunit delta [Candidatus Omnitrophica bacterium]|nr:ATP synthase F1 subunit delta [Candidatus Omnitrophota bacterium]
MPRPLARRYARALFELCREYRNLEPVHQDLKKIKRLLEESHELVRFLDNPVVPPAKRESILKEAFQGKVEAVTYRFLLFLEARRRSACLGAICEAFDHLYTQAHGIVNTRWTVHDELSRHDVHLMTEHLKKKLGLEIEAERKTDPDILGGIKVRVGDIVYDYTLRAQLRKFQQNVMSA